MKINQILSKILDGSCNLQFIVIVIVVIFIVIVNIFVVVPVVIIIIIVNACYSYVLRKVDVSLSILTARFMNGFIHIFTWNTLSSPPQPRHIYICCQSTFLVSYGRHNYRILFFFVCSF